MRLMQVYGLHKGVLMTTFPKCAPTNCQGHVSAETPRVHARIPPGQPHSYSSQTEHNHTHLTPRASESNGLETHRYRAYRPIKRHVVSTEKCLRPLYQRMVLN